MTTPGHEASIHTPSGRIRSIELSTTTHHSLMTIGIWLLYVVVYYFSLALAV